LENVQKKAQRTYPKILVSGWTPPPSFWKFSKSKQSFLGTASLTELILLVLFEMRLNVIYLFWNVHRLFIWSQ
jgi:hypothetical protein